MTRAKERFTNRARRSSEAGASLIEFSIVAPLFLLLVIAAFDFGRMLYLELYTFDANRMAARLEGLGNFETRTTDGPTEFRNRLDAIGFDRNREASLEVKNPNDPIKRIETAAPIDCLFCNLWKRAPGELKYQTKILVRRE